MRFLRSLALLPNYCHPPCLISAPNHAPVAADSAAGRRACAARPRGKAGSERRKACFHPGGSGFHLPRGWPGPLPVLFNRLLRHTQVLCFFLDSRKKRNPFAPLRPSFPRSPVPFWEPPRALAKQLKHFCAFMQCFIARKLHFIHTLGIIYGEKLWITWTTKWG